MIRKTGALLLFALFFLFSCQNKISKPYEISDSDEDLTGDSDVVSDSDVESDADAEPLIFDLSVERNSQNSLSCRLNFRTGEAKRLSVRYFSPYHPGYRISEDEPESDHYFFLWGMRENQDYTIEICDEEGKILATSQYRSGNLPYPIPAMTLDLNDQERTAPGFVLFHYATTNMELVWPIALMVDREGYIVWYFEYWSGEAGTFGDLTWNPEKQSIVIGLVKDYSSREIPGEDGIEIDLEGNILWKAPEIPGYYYYGDSWNHTYQHLEDGSVLFPKCLIENCIYYDTIVNLDGDDYTPIWQWSFADHFEMPATSCAETEAYDWTHVNSVTMDKSRGVVYVNSRNFSSLFKIDIESGDILWRLGADGGFTFTGAVGDPCIGHAHDPEINGNRVLFYDNGTPERGYSRVIEYTIDEETMTAEVSFVFDGRELGMGWWSEFFGDADRLPNGNILVTVGDYDLNQHSRIFELTPEGEPVWELLFEKSDNSKVVLYKSEKIIPRLEPLN